MGDFWQKARQASAALSTVFNGRPASLRRDRPADATATQRGIALGHAPGILTSDHFNELQHFKSWVFVGVDAIGKQWEQADWEVYDTSWGQKRKAFGPGGPSQKRTPLKDHPVARLLKRPNPFKNRRAFMYQVACQLRLTGACLIWDVRDQFKGGPDGRGDPSELWVIPRGWLWPLPPHPGRPLGGWRVTPILSGTPGWYRSLPSSMTGGFILDVRETFTVGRSHPLYPGESMSPLEACSQLLDIMFQTDTATWSSFVNSINPGILVSIGVQPGDNLTKEQVDQVREEVVARYAGAENTRRPIIGANIGMQPIQTAPSELDYVNGRAQNRDNTLAIQNVPPIAVGLDSDGTYSGSAAKLNQFSELAIAPDIALFADDVTARFEDRYGDDFEVVGKAKRYDDPDLDLRKAQLFASIYAMRRGDVRISENEARAVIELEPIDGGDEYPVPKEQAEQAAQQAATQAAAQAQPGGAATPGAPPDDLDVGDVGGADAESPADFPIDLNPDPPTDDSTGVRQPFRRAKAVGANGSLNGHGGILP